MNADYVRKVLAEEAEILRGRGEDDPLQHFRAAKTRIHEELQARHIEALPRETEHCARYAAAVAKHVKSSKVATLADIEWLVALKQKSTRELSEVQKVHFEGLWEETERLLREAGVTEPAAKEGSK